MSTLIAGLAIVVVGLGAGGAASRMKSTPQKGMLLGFAGLLLVAGIVLIGMNVYQSSR